MNANDRAALLTDEVRPAVIRLALIGPSGSGKSTSAGLFSSGFAKHGLRVGVYKLSRPLYELQEQFYAIARRPTRPEFQDQKLLEFIATQLRSLSATALIDDLVARLNNANEDVILNDDLRDDMIDWPIMRSMGFLATRIVTPETVRQRRLHERCDVSVVGESQLDLQIARIPARFVVYNGTDSLSDLQRQVDQIIARILELKYVPSADESNSL